MSQNRSAPGRRLLRTLLEPGVRVKKELYKPGRN